MRTLLRFRRYLRTQRRTIVFGLVCTAVFALMSGFSIGLILPVVDEVLLGDGGEGPRTLAVGEGLADVARDASGAWSRGDGIGDRLDRVRKAAVAGLERVQREADPRDLLVWLCGFTLVAVLLKNLADYGRRVAFIRVEQRAAHDIRRDLFAHILAFPLAVHRSYPGGQLLSRVVTDVELLKQYTINTAVQFVRHSSQLVVLFALCVWASPRLSLVSFVIVPPIVLLTGRLSHKLRKQSGRAQQRIADVTTRVTESLANIRVVKGFAMEHREERTFTSLSRGYTDAVIRLLSLDTLAQPLSEFWGVAIGVSVLYVGGSLVLDPDSSMTAGRFFVFLLALVSMLHPLKALANTVTTFQRGAAVGDRILDLFALPTEAGDDGDEAVDAVEGEVRFRGVDFAYEPGREVLRDVTFTAPAGTTTALVGPSGGGKSTLVDLIPRFHDPTAGEVLLDGRDLRRLRRKDLRSRVGIVTQETILFDTTVAENIAYGVEDASREAIEGAARTANAHGFITGLPEGYDTRIGDRGARLSGGQRQRLAIARALLRNPPILVLDEATSSLDTESEAAVQEALDRLLAHRTTFVIAHRLSTILDADRILVLDAGRVVAEGPHAELLETSPLYRRLYDLQFRDAVERADS